MFLSHLRALNLSELGSRSARLVGSKKVLMPRLFSIETRERSRANPVILSSPSWPISSFNTPVSELSALLTLFRAELALVRRLGARGGGTTPALDGTGVAPEGASSGD